MFTNRYPRQPHPLPHHPIPNSRENALELEQLTQLVVASLEDMKARDIQVIDVRGKTAITDVMVIASGTSERHVKAVAETVAFRAKEAGEPPLGTEGLTEGEWALVDLNIVVVHVMLPKVRDFYALERLWSAAESSRKSAS